MDASGEFAHLLMIDDEITGRWRRDATTRSAVVHVQPFRALTRVEKRAVEAEVDRYGTFIGLPATAAIQ